MTANQAGVYRQLMLIVGSGITSPRSGVIGLSFSPGWCRSLNREREYHWQGPPW